MTDDKDLLLQQFFSEAAQQQIADNGFTERVMQQLPKTEEQLAQEALQLPKTEEQLAQEALRVVPSQAVRKAQQATMRRINRLWTVACIAIFVALFIVFRGWEMLAIQLEVMLRTLSVESFSINPLMLFVILFGLLFVGVGEVITSEQRWP